MPSSPDQGDAPGRVPAPAEVPHVPARAAAHRPLPHQAREPEPLRVLGVLVPARQGAWLVRAQPQDYGGDDGGADGYDGGAGVVITLRPDDQQPFVNGLRSSLARLREQGLPQRVMGRAECGFGKTVSFSYISKRARERGVRVLLAVHRKELVDQISNTLREFEVPHGIISAGYAADPRQLVQVCSVFSLARRLERTAKPGLLIMDEGHHCVSGTTWGDILTHWHDVPTLAFTATPARLSGEGYDDLFFDMVQGPSARWLIENGRLNPYRLFAPTGINTADLHKRAGEFIAGEVEELTTKPRIVGDVISHYERTLNGAPTVAFCVSVKAAHMLAESFRERGWKAAAVDGKMEDDERRRVIADTRRGALNVTTSCALIGEGLDVGSLQGAILMNPTASLSKFIQEAMRPLRYGVNKPISVINDHVGNCERHGLPDADREWSLKGREKRKREAMESPVSSCPQCYRTIAQGTKCPCGYVAEPTPREVEQVDGELAEVDVLAQRRERLAVQGSARSLEALTEVGIQRYGAIKGPRWAAHVHKARLDKAAREAGELERRYQRETGT